LYNEIYKPKKTFSKNEIFPTLFTAYVYCSLFVNFFAVSVSGCLVADDSTSEELLWRGAIVNTEA